MGISKKHGAVSAGHEKTAWAAEQILASGGNAYDAVLAAFFASCVCEPVLASLGGGGFLTSLTHEGKKKTYDFFVDTPGAKLASPDVDFYPIVADFGGQTTQEFHVGLASVAVPGSVRGIFHVHRDLGSLPMSTIVAPAISLAREGVLVNAFQAYIFQIVKDIYLSSSASMALFGSIKKPGSLVGEGEVYRLREYADFLECLARDGEDFFYDGEISRLVSRDMVNAGGHLSHSDFSRYSCVVRDSLCVDYGRAEFITNPPPSVGGLLIAFALRVSQNVDLNQCDHDSFEYLSTLSSVMGQTNQARVDESVANRFSDSNFVCDFLSDDLVRLYAEKILGCMNRLGSTTQMSVVDGLGNVASMTVTNGEGSGYVIPGTGIVMNNMLGEEDLHPDGFGAWREGERLSSMMAPSVLSFSDGRRFAIGSGGSNRIRTAVLQVLLRLLSGVSVSQAVSSSRIHFERDLLHVEPGFSSDVIDRLRDFSPEIRLWKQKDLFFGGVHVAGVDSNKGGFSGAGDLRRGGVFREA
ncbi:MAG: gamma-glutamyltransferase [Candidatus Moranbacteria bacterium]|nr:gamma-glutamyltransferase [Candidatus Moranbacteria bacterium]